MSTRIIILKSITHAMRGQNILNSYRIRNRLERNVYAVSKYGCGYGLRVALNDLDRAVSILKANDFNIKEIMK